MNRGTIACRRDPDDKAEWQFSLKKSVDWVKEEEKHQVQGEAANKVEAVEWMKLRAEGLLEMFLATVRPMLLCSRSWGRRRSPKPCRTGSLKQKHQRLPLAKKKMSIGDRKDTKEATSRVSKMLKLVKSVQKQVGSEKAKALNSSLEALKKLEKVKKTQLGKGQDHTV